MTLRLYEEQIIWFVLVNSKHHSEHVQANWNVFMSLCICFNFSEAVSSEKSYQTHDHHDIEFRNILSVRFNLNSSN